MDLLLIRHAVAFERDPQQWPDDRDRPLTPQGARSFKRSARGLGELAGSLDAVLSSPFVRAWSTAEILHRVAGWPEPLVCAALESGRGPAEVVDALQLHQAARRLALVGHEPNLQELVGHLLGVELGPDQLEMKKGGLIWLRFPDGGVRAGAGTLRGALPPRVLRALA